MNGFCSLYLTIELQDILETLGRSCDRPLWGCCATVRDVDKALLEKELCTARKYIELR